MLRGCASFGIETPAVHERLIATTQPCGRERHGGGKAVEGGLKMINGITVLVLAVGVLAAIWIIVLWGSSFFGPRVD